MTAAQRATIDALKSVLAKPGLFRGRRLVLVEIADPFNGALAVEFEPAGASSLKSTVSFGVGPAGEIMGCVEQELNHG